MRTPTISVMPVSIPFIFLFTLCYFVSPTLSAQFDGPPDTPEEYAKQYQWRIAQETLNGVYIPANLNEALTELNRLTDEESRKSFASLPEEQAFRRLFHSLRLWIINKWGLNGGSRLSYLFHDLKLKHPDDLAELIIVSWHRQLNDRPINMKESVERILEARRAAWEASKEKRN